VERALELCGPVASDCFDYLSLALPATRLPKGWAAEGVAAEAVRWGFVAWQLTPLAVREAGDSRLAVFLSHALLH
jgi:hypothetical protein